MNVARPDAQIYKEHHLALFPENCREECIVAKAAAARAARLAITREITLETSLELHAPRFGRCALGPTIKGRCGKLSICNNELAEGSEDIIEAAHLLTIN